MDIKNAHENFNNLQKSTITASAGLYVTAKLLYEAKYNKYYKILGYGTLAEYAAQAEVGLSANTTSQLIAVYEKFCLNGGISTEHKILVEQNIFKDYTKAYKSIPLLSNHAKEDVIDIVVNNSQADIVERVKEAQGIQSIYQSLEDQLKDLWIKSKDLVLLDFIKEAKNAFVSSGWRHP